MVFSSLIYKNGAVFGSHFTPTKPTQNKNGVEKCGFGFLHPLFELRSQARDGDADRPSLSPCHRASHGVVLLEAEAVHVVERLTPVSASFIREDVLARLDRFERFTCFTRCRVGLSLSLEVRTCFPHVCERLGERVERNDFSKDAFLGVTSVESRRLVAQGRVRERRHVTDSQSL